jgi:7-cyano-7-deazaguanine reductase
MTKSPSKGLETFPNPQPDRDYIIEIETPEFTCLCPKTGQPDFATLQLEYVPDKLCVELKSLKLYIWSYRNEGHFHEKVTNTILSDLVAATKPRYMRVEAYFNVRGGLYTTVHAEHRMPGWSEPLPPPENLPRVKQDARTAGTPSEKRESATPKPASKREGSGARRVAAETPPTADVAAETQVPDPIPLARGPRSSRFRMLARTREGATPPAAVAAVAPPPPPAPAAPPRDLYIGIDIGTTGARAVAIDTKEEILAFTQAGLPAPARHEGQVTQDPGDWWKAISAALKELLTKIDATRVHRIAIAGTSGTLVLCDKKGVPVSPGLMYNDRRAQAEADRIAGVADDLSAAFGTSGSLAKLLWLQEKKSNARAAHALHQADWIAGRLAGNFGHSDYHNCLKLGFDPDQMIWPDWFRSLGVTETLLPQVHAPGDVIGTISASAATVFGLPPEAEIVAGTTDSVAAFIAAGGSKPGHGVTVLGSTLALKLLSEQRVVSPKNGVYSHRLGRYWLAGGASNTGGNVLLQYFSLEQIQEMTPLLDPDMSTDLNYYPLAEPGERFPIDDPRMPPKLEPLPSDSVMFLQGILEGMANIEAQGYAALADLGAPHVNAIWTAGSGAQNPGWTKIRERTLGTKLKKARSEHAAFGAALIAAGILQKSFA